MMLTSTISVELDAGEYALAAQGADLSYEYNESFSYAVWFKTTVTGDYLLTKLNSSGRGYGLYIMAGGQLEALVNNTFTLAARLGTDAAYNDGAWHLAVVTYDGTGLTSGITIYVDGVAVAATPTYETLASQTIVNTQPFQVSGRTGATSPYDGWLGPVAVWNKKLSSVEAWAVWNLGMPGDLTVHPASANLQGYWRLGESGDVVALDDSGHYRHLAWWALLTSDYDTDLPSSKDRYSTVGVNFDGTGYVTMGDVLNKEYTDSFTVLCWIKTTSTGGYVVCKQTIGANQYRGYGVAVTGTGTFDVWLRSNNATSNAIHVECTTAVNDGNWHQLAFTWAGSGSPAAADLTLYLDGLPAPVSVLLDALSATIDNTASFNLGARNDGADALWTGVLGDAAVLSRELTAAEIKESYNDGTPPMLTETSVADVLEGWWRGVNSSYPTLTDLSISGNDGTMTSMAATDFVSGVTPYTSSLCMAGGGNMSMGNVYAFEYTDNFSISTWQLGGTTGVAVGKQGNSSPYRGYVIARSGSEVYVEINSTVVSNTITLVTVGAGLHDNQWHHVVLTYTGAASPDAANVRVYVDGVQAAVSVIYNNLTATIVSTNNFKIGSRDGGWSYNGWIDEVTVYNAVLSPIEVTELYNGGLPPDPRGVSSRVSLQSWWRLGEDDGSSIAYDSVGSYDAGGFGGTVMWYLSSPATGTYYNGIADPVDLVLFQEGMLKSFGGAFLEQGVDDYPTAPSIFYRMRGWNTNSLSWENWTSVDAPNLTPPVGPCVNISVTAEWS